MIAIGSAESYVEITSPETQAPPTGTSGTLDGKNANKDSTTKAISAQLM